jgi:hypothetical protein
MVGQIGSSTFVSDPVLFIRDSLRTNITDPISSTRGSSSAFVMTSFPQRNVLYPMLIVKSTGPTQNKRLVMQSQQSWMDIPIEVRVWGRNVVERDSLSQQVFAYLQKNQFGTGSQTIPFGLHDFNLISNIPIDDVDENGKDTGIRTQQMKYNWKSII